MINSRVCFRRIAALEAAVRRKHKRPMKRKTVRRIDPRLPRIEEKISEHEQHLARHDERINHFDHLLRTLTERLDQIPVFDPTEISHRLHSTDQSLAKRASEIERIKEKTKKNRDQIKQMRQSLLIHSNDVPDEELKKIKDELERLNDEVNRMKNLAEAPPTPMRLDLSYLTQPISESLSTLGKEFRIEIQQINELLAGLKSQLAHRPVPPDPISPSRVAYEVSLPPKDLLDDTWTEY